MHHPTVRPNPVRRLTSFGLVALSAALAAPAAAQASLPPVQLTLSYTGNGAPKDLPAVQAALNAVLSKKINATVQLQAYDWGSYDQKLNLAFASNQTCDLVFSAGWLNYPQKAAAGDFLALDALLPRYAPTTWKAYSPQAWGATKVDGKIYSVILGQLTPRTFGIYVRKDLADKYKLDLTKLNSYDDLTPFFAKVKAGEPGITPLAYARVMNEALGQDSLLNFGMVAVRFNDPALKAIAGVDSPEFKAYLRLVRQWYVAGYLPKDPVSQADAGAGMKAGKYAAWQQEWTPTSTPTLAAQWGFPVVGKSLSKYADLTTESTTGQLVSVCRTSKNPERAVMLAELLNTDPAVYTLLARGIEGKNWAWSDQAHKVIGLPKGVTAESNGYAPGTDWMFGTNNGYFFDSLDQARAQPAMAKYRQTAKSSAALGFTFNTDPVKSQVAQLNALWGEFATIAFSGQKDPDQLIAQYDPRFKAAGLDQVIAEAQRQLDAWKKTR